MANDYLAVPESGSGPGVLVLHTWWGLNDFIKDLCDRLTGQGFVVLAPDMYDGATTADHDEADRLSEQVMQGDTANLLKDAAERLQAHPAVSSPQIGVMGFSLGAFWALELAVNHVPEAVKAVVLFYGNRPGIETQTFARSQAAFLGHFAENDEFEPLDEILQTQEKIQQAGKAVTFYQYPGTGHWFAESNQADAYHADAAKLAWERTLEFLNQTLK